MGRGWIRYPTVHGDTVVFGCEDDLWTAPLAGGLARRLTTGLGACARPRLSPDGARIAFDGAEEGVRDVYVVDAAGGALRRLTWHGDGASVLGWSPEGEVVFASAVGRPFFRETPAWVVSPDGGIPRELPFGPLAGVAWRADGRVALCRHQTDLAWWKRYRGGRVGALWVQDGGGRFRKLALGDVNLAAPLWHGERLYFVADPDGTPELASCEPDGSDLQVHTAHGGLAVRFPTTDGRTIVYTWGGDLFVFDPGTGRSREIEVDVRSQRTERQRRFPQAAKYLETFDLHPDGHSLALVVRGRPFVAGCWEGPVRQVGQRDGVRYRLARWVDAGRLVVVSDRTGEEALEVHALSDGAVRSLPHDLHGRVVDLEVDPTGRRAAFTDHRYGLFVADLETGEVRALDRSETAPVTGPTWSSDGRWLAWVRPEGFRGARTRVRLCDVPGGGVPVDVTSGAYYDLHPSFDPDGQHLYFLSCREFDPVSDTITFGYAFPRGMRPYLVTLGRDLRDPFQPDPRPLTKPTKNGRVEVQVDLEGLADRVVPFPLPEGRYEQVVGVGQGQVLLTRAPVRGTLDRTWYDPGPPKADLQLLVWEFDRQELTELNPRVSTLRADRKREHVAVRSGARLRVVLARGDKTQREELKKTEGRTDRKGGWIDLGRVRPSVDPGAEWSQMLREAWRLMRDHYWDDALAGVDWDGVYERYRGLLDRVATRGELSDLLWCTQGEMGTSHAYEMGGDYVPQPTWRVGRLGADFAWDAAGGWRIVRLVRGEPGDKARSTPLLAPGVALADGDLVVALGGASVQADVPIDQQLVNLADQPVELTVRSASGERRVVVKALPDDRPLRYRDWVLSNRRRVHEATGGRSGYVHVPDMGPPGFAEFHRDFALESERDALVVDVRHNRGGHVSQLLLGQLARRRLAYKIARWGLPSPYPAYAVAGPMVCLTNELAGSDGDIFSHAWKMLGLGPLVGTRTWGGTVGIWPRHLLVDRGVTTQPEFATWFADVAYGLENGGAVPDDLVEVAPEDHAAGRDPQLDRAVTRVLEALDAHPPAPSAPRRR